ncbi:hypothetical protein PSQ20_06850 [Curvibacter sp. RS43]|uniref:Uncharacterized protein n=1 Tax=Curvibacter microcysteis TaxID=3026419 RepID=A0ABT5MF68_9BURK|nr:MULTISPECIES: hypothetical protein [unclassified Curvibacter]MDD0810048.1 hypothetical protein [Curvibacter sp. RS43]MDD0815216.1 hypothetical protein [Curvibacter sp. HBC28]
MSKPMPTSRALQRLQTLIWVLIYGGLLSLVLGLAMERGGQGLGDSLRLWGAVIAVLGVLLIPVRAWLEPRD